MRATPPIHTVVLPRLGSGPAGPTAPFVLVIDDTHLIRGRRHARVPRGRARPPADRLHPRAGRSEHAGRCPSVACACRTSVAEFGPRELAMTLPEADAAHAGRRGRPVPRRPARPATTTPRGGRPAWPSPPWPSPTAATTTRSLAGFGGDHRLVAEYLHDELLAGLPEDISTFLTRASVLPATLRRRSAMPCSRPAAAGRCSRGSRRSKNLFVLPLDDVGRWYRFHHLFADLLRAELHAQRPGTRARAAPPRQPTRREGRRPRRRDPPRHRRPAIDRAADLVLTNALDLRRTGPQRDGRRCGSSCSTTGTVRSYPQLALATALHQLGARRSRRGRLLDRRGRAGGPRARTRRSSGP